jgi:hypothetical protein
MNKASIEDRYTNYNEFKILIEILVTFRIIILHLSNKNDLR